ncbi:ATP-binding protein [Rhodococcus sp. HNM0569]|uniref:AAA family ATPase n=1 Tax=Rhodococcus sp. HNM0569 TaxID=2716340 RepID=UPI00146BD903|nr:ATP-binding protein [Rhodococcus sp. HNM0569]NLU82725.1 26S protease regulatory subunit [Rhodococcus sp. HNM0569]
MTTDVSPSLDGLLAGTNPTVRATLDALGRLLTGTGAARPTADSFASRRLGAPLHLLAAQSVKLTASTEITLAGVLATRIHEHAAETGPGEDDEPPRWRTVEIDHSALSVPVALSAFFPRGTLADADVVVRIAEQVTSDRLEIRVFAAAEDHAVASGVAKSFVRDAHGAGNFLRGRVLAASYDYALRFDVTTLQARGRDSLVLPDEVWRELDAAVAAVTTRAEILRELGLATRRGILLAGPPGVGKTAASWLLAAELVGAFTVIVVDESAGGARLRDVYAEAAELGPTVVLLDDIDLYVGSRTRGTSGSSLAALLDVLDGAVEHDDILTIATTNDPSALDSAATRSARFDTIVELGYPTRAASAQILASILSPVAPSVDFVAALAIVDGPLSGADVRAIAQRAVIDHGTDLDEAKIRSVVEQGRWKTSELTGQYL